MLDPSARPTSSQPEAIPQVIRLSLPSIATRSTEMTQQEKVAAALMRAGIASPASWTDSSTTQAASQSTSTAIAEPPVLAAQQPVATPSPSLQRPSFDWRRRLLLLAGSLLALASGYLLFRIH